MDHSHMDHSNIAHGSEMQRCEMSMLFNWNVKNICIVFRWWHITTTLDLILSLLAVAALTAGYEALRAASRRYELSVDKQRDELPHGSVTESTPLLRPGRTQVEVSKRAHIIKAFLYAAQTFYAFMLMLLFMTYNGWVMLAVSVGAFVGYVFFGNSTSATKDSACH